MSYVTKRTDSDVYQFVYRTPAKVLAKLKGRTLLISLPFIRDEAPHTVRPRVGEKIKFSLKTTNKEVAQAREIEALRQIESYCEAANSNEISLKKKGLVSISRAIYVAYVEFHQEEPGLPRRLAEHKALSRAIYEGRINSQHPAKMLEINGSGADELFGDDLTAGVNALPPGEADRNALESRFGELADFVLAQHRIAVDDETRGRLLLECAAASIDAAWRLKDHAAGDYGPDKRIERFGDPFVAPKGQKPSEKPQAGSKTTLTTILADWWKEAQATGRKPSTYESYSHTIDNLVAFVGHDDATKVTPEKVVEFKDHRLAYINPRTRKPISAKTVKDSDLAALKTIFEWAVTNRRLPSNPATGITIKLGKRKVTRSKGFTDEEAKALLDAADARQRGNEHPKNFAAKRWVPWLCAYTGSRVGEMVQLRKQDVQKVGNQWVIHITPEAGTVKTDEARDVVMHEHLVAKGFPDFVKNSPDDYLFITPKADGSIRGPWKTRKNDLIEAARETVKDSRVSPNHAFRHRFKTVGMEAEIDHRVLDAIQGQKARTVAETYGDVTLKTQALAMAKFPRQV